MTTTHTCMIVAVACLVAWTQLREGPLRQWLAVLAIASGIVGALLNVTEV